MPPCLLCRLLRRSSHGPAPLTPLPDDGPCRRPARRRRGRGAGVHAPLEAAARDPARARIPARPVSDACAGVGGGAPGRRTTPRPRARGRAPVANPEGGGRRRVRGEATQPRSGRPFARDPPRRAPALPERHPGPRPAQAGDARLCERAGKAARPDRGDVQHGASGARPDARRSAHPLAHALGLRERREARPRAAPGRTVSPRCDQAPRQRDAACLVHARPPEQLRDPCS